MSKKISLFGRNITFGATDKRAVNPLEKAVISALRDFESGTESATQIHISEESSLALSAVWRCVSLISDSISMLPIHVYQRTSNGREETKHELSSLLKKPTPYLTKADFFKIMTTHVTLWGNAYAKIIYYNSGRVARLKIVDPWSVQVAVNDNDELFYKVGSDIIPSRDMIHIRGFCVDGKTGKSPIAAHRENLRLSAAAQRYGETFFARGGRVPGVFEHPGELSDEAYDRLLRDLVIRTASDSHKPLLLEGGTKYQQFAIPPEDAQFIATRKFQATEVARIFGVPPHMIADLDRATNNNIEQQAMEYVNYCLMPLLVKFEEEINDKLFTISEQETYFIKFNVNALMRGDTASRGNYYRNMYYIGAMNPNEIRAKEDMNAYDGGEEYMVQQNMQTVNNAINQTNE